MLRVRLWDEREGKEETGKQSPSPHQELLGSKGGGARSGKGRGSLWGPDNSGISLFCLFLRQCLAMSPWLA